MSGAVDRASISRIMPGSRISSGTLRLISSSVALLAVMEIAAPQSARAQSDEPPPAGETVRPAPAGSAGTPSSTGTPGNPAGAANPGTPTNPGTPATVAPAQTWCTLPLCRDAEGLRSSGDLRGALKLYLYIQAEVDVDDKVLRKPLLWFQIASLHAELKQFEEAQEALRKYQQYVATVPESELPAGMGKAEVEALASSLRARPGKLRVLSGVAGLQILIDGQEVGKTPIAQPIEVPPGRHRVEVRGAAREAQEVEVLSAQELLVWAVQPLTSAPNAHVSERAARPGWRLALGGVALAAGVAFVAGGIAALVEDGRCASTAGAMGCPVEVGTNGTPVMRFVDGRPVGASLVVLGALSIAGGGVLLGLPGKKRSAQALISPSASGLNLGLGFSY